MKVSKRVLVRVVGILISIVALGFIAVRLGSLWPQVAALSFSPLPLMLAFGCGAVTLLTYAGLWRTLLAQLGGHIPMFTAIRIWFLSQIVRYAPGNVWHLLGRVYLASQHHVAATTVVYSTMLELFQSLTTAVLVGSLSLFFWPAPPLFRAGPLLVLPALAIYCWPSLMERPLRWLAQPLNRPIAFIPIRSAVLWRLFPWYCFTWVMYGCGLYLLARSITPLPINTLPALMGMFAIAWVAGFVSFVTPSGLGVREGVLGYLLSLIMPLPQALILSLLARVWLILVEVACTAFVASFPLLWKRKAAP